jgi:hypothetical protein
MNVNGPLAHRAIISARALNHYLFERQKEKAAASGPQANLYIH